MNNATTILLLGFPGPYSFRIVFFLFLFITFLATICGNLMVITLVAYSKNLQSPMYFFLTQLTTSDIITTSSIVPNMLHMFLNNGSSMSISQCITQLFFFGSSEASECLLLTVMSYDRYLAICHPLHYESVMNPRFLQKLVILSWTLSISINFIITVNVSQLQFCRSDVINHFFCDFDPILRVSCSNIFRTKLLSTILSFPVIMCPFLIVVTSYVSIVHTILRIQSISHRRKAFSTCGSHLTVVSIFYGTLISIYISPIEEKSVALHKCLSFVYTVLTPLTNPVIYCLRNKEIKEAFKKIL
ncbi:olfactory receptor 11L1-like [Bufo bufo]|uniref:olfactory receptor 11L1-like n=1 Tax=Bufo bufo TaxID=8384 RepID=UPI001ABE2D25|nr:olfactory receptor 11L1-like [Bufo bufo]